MPCVNDSQMTSNARMQSAHLLSLLKNTSPLHCLPLQIDCRCLITFVNYPQVTSVVPLPTRRFPPLKNAFLHHGLPPYTF